jgi:hypothetical protein
VNSSTSSSDIRHRIYVKWIFILVYLPAFALFVFGIYLQPLYGDLTRIGFYSEKNFGWTQQQLKFTTPLYNTDTYNRYYDVVILGDSFSRGWPKQQWQNHLAVATDWTILTHSKWDAAITEPQLNSILDSQVFRDTPPKVFIIESVERSFIKRIKTWPACSASQTSIALKSPPLPSKRPDLYIADKEKASQYINRPTDWSDIKLGFLLNYLWNNGYRAIYDTDNTVVEKIPLARAAPLSNSLNQELLVLKDDLLTPATWHELEIAEINCRIETMRAKIEANGKTKFVLIIAPDKMNAYADFALDEKLHTRGLLKQISAQHPDTIPATDLALEKAINLAEMDVYLPDDTHWGSTGNQIVADTVLEFLRNH